MGEADDAGADVAADGGAGTDGNDAAFSEVNLSGVRIQRASIVLKQQFRIDASNATVQWINDLIDGRPIGPIPAGEKYQIRVVDSPVDLHQVIKGKVTEEGEHGLSRLLATYDWPYASAKNPGEPNGRWCVEMHREKDGRWATGLLDGDNRGYIAGSADAGPGSDRFCLPRNYGISSNGSAGLGKKSWAERPETVDEVGSTFTIQGFDLNYAGAIIGPSVKLREGRVVFDRSTSCSSAATNKREGRPDYSEQNLHNELNVLLKRGVHGLYLFAVDPALQAALKAAAQR